jgi:glucuronoarabinoxylan endo-1,4-beta-xylanase
VRITRTTTASFALLWLAAGLTSACVDTGTPRNAGSAGVNGGGAGGMGGATGTGGAAGTGGAGGAMVTVGTGPAGPTVSGDVDVTVSVDADTRAQTMQGFGASLAFYVNYLTDHPSKAEVYDIIFRNLGLDVLRVGNWYQTGTVDAQTVEVVQQARASLGAAPRLVMSSWSPPASMKSNNDTKNGGTLAQQNGAFAYDAFGDWWASALAAYAAAGVVPDYVSVQNEPDFQATWESCRLGATETATRAGYAPALAAVSARLAGLGSPPQLLGPELASAANGRVQTYLASVSADSLGGIAHHLYGGGTEADGPDSYLATMQDVAASAGGKPIFMTEFGPQAPDPLDTAWLIYNAVTVEGVSAYLYWGLVWAAPAAGSPPQGLVTVENPYDRGSWTTTKGYIINPTFFALEHYARWIDAGWQRVGASSTADAVKASAFASPDGSRVTVVLLNTDGAPHTVAVAVAAGGGPFAFTTSALYRTSGTDEQGAALGPLGGGNAVTLAPRAIVTAVLGR